MTQTPAGWYPDPAPGRPGVPQGQRYWDGQRWTEHVHAPTPAVPPPYVPTPYAPTVAYGTGPAVPTTPDGQRLAGWWARVGAYVVDSLILLPLVVLAGWPFVSRVVGVYGDFVQQAIRAAENGTAAPGQGALLADTFLPMLGIAAVSVVVNFVYNVGFLRWRQATPGKLLLGLRVRRRDTAGELPWSTILIRWVTQNWPAFFAVVPFLGGLLGLYPLLDDLWPLWDDKRQALHDKAAATNVVVHRR